MEGGAQATAKIAVAWAIVLCLGGTLVLHLLRATLAFKIAAMMGRISQQVATRLLSDRPEEAEGESPGLVPGSPHCHVATSVQ
jgi:hypothetical protein